MKPERHDESLGGYSLGSDPDTEELNRERVDA
jgi:hypothetical protein